MGEFRAGLPLPAPKKRKGFTMCIHCDLKEIEVRELPGGHIHTVGIGKEFGGIHIERRYGIYMLVTEIGHSWGIKNCPMCGRELDAES